MQNPNYTLDQITNFLITKVKRAQFASIQNYHSKTSGETSNVIVNLKVSYVNAKAKDIDTLSQMLASNDIPVIEGYTTDEIKNEMIKIKDALITPNKKRSDGQKNAYTFIKDDILKVHNENKKIYIWAQSIKKDVIKEGNHKPLSFREKVKFACNLRTAYFRNYMIDNFDKFKSGEIILGYKNKDIEKY